VMPSAIVKITVGNRRDASNNSVTATPLSSVANALGESPGLTWKGRIGQ
jgi:hypothetical protein